jgi:putative tryptophan/tyrosine transport system substrate-binding protein
VKNAGLLTALAVCAGVALSSHAQVSSKTSRIGILSPGSSTEAPWIQREPFERGLRDLGWAPDANISIVYRYAEGSVPKLQELAAELVQSRVDVIVARAPAAIQAAQAATPSIPIVMSASNDPVEEGFVDSMSKPGRNATGIATLVWELDSKRLELLKETFPAITRVAVLANPQFDAGRFADRVATLRASARSLKLQLEVFAVEDQGAIAQAFSAMRRAKIDGLLVRADPHVLDHSRAEIAALAAKFRLPAIYPWRFFAEAGGLISYGTSIPGFHRRSAAYVDRILRGAKPQELPVEQPTQYELVVNVAAAKAQGIDLPKALLFRADHLIQ